MTRWYTAYIDMLMEPEESEVISTEPRCRILECMVAISQESSTDNLWDIATKIGKKIESNINALKWERQNYKIGFYEVRRITEMSHIFPVTDKDRERFYKIDIEQEIKNYEKFSERPNQEMTSSMQSIGIEEAVPDIPWYVEKLKTMLETCYYEYNLSRSNLHDLASGRSVLIKNGLL